MFGYNQFLPVGNVENGVTAGAECGRGEGRWNDGTAAKNNKHRNDNDVGMSVFTTSNLYIMNYVN